MKKKIISSIKYICHNKQLKNVRKFIPMNISELLPSTLKKTPDSDIFFFFLFQFLNSKLQSLMIFMPT